MRFSEHQTRFIKAGFDTIRLNQVLEKKNEAERQQFYSELAGILEREMIPVDKHFQAARVRNDAELRAGPYDHYYWMLNQLSKSVTSTQSYFLKQGLEFKKWQQLPAEIRKWWDTQEMNGWSWGISVGPVNVGWSYSAKNSDIALVVPLLQELRTQNQRLNDDIGVLLTRQGFPALSDINESVQQSIQALPDSLIDSGFKREVCDLTSAEEDVSENNFSSGCSKSLTNMFAKTSQLRSSSEAEALAHLDIMVNNGILVAQIMIGSKNSKAAAQFGTAARICSTLFFTSIALANKWINPLAALTSVSSVLPMIASLVVASDDPTAVLVKEIGQQLQAIHTSLEGIRIVQEEILNQLHEIKVKLDRLDTNIKVSCQSIISNLNILFEDALRNSYNKIHMQLRYSLDAKPFDPTKTGERLIDLAAFALGEAQSSAIIGIIPSSRDELEYELVRRGTLAKSLALLPSLEERLGLRSMIEANLPHPILWAESVMAFIMAQIQAPIEIVNSSLDESLAKLKTQGLSLKSAFAALTRLEMVENAKSVYRAAANAWQIAVLRNIETVFGYRYETHSHAFREILRSTNASVCEYFQEIFPKLRNNQGGAAFSRFFSLGNYSRRDSNSEYAAVYFKEIQFGVGHITYGTGEIDLLYQLNQLGYLHRFDEHTDLSHYDHIRRCKNYTAHEDRIITFRFAGPLEGIATTFKMKSFNDGGNAYTGRRFSLIDCSRYSVTDNAEVRKVLKGKGPSEYQRFTDFLMAVYNYAKTQSLNHSAKRVSHLEGFVTNLHKACFTIAGPVKDATQALDKAALRLKIIGLAAQWRLGRQSNPVICFRGYGDSHSLYDGSMHQLDVLAEKYFNNLISGGNDEELIQQMRNYFESIANRFNSDFDKLNNTTSQFALVDYVLDHIETFTNEKLKLRLHHQIMSKLRNPNSMLLIQEAKRKQKIQKAYSRRDLILLAMSTIIFASVFFLTSHNLEEKDRIGSRLSTGLILAPAVLVSLIDFCAEQDDYLNSKKFIGAVGGGGAIVSSLIIATARDEQKYKDIHFDLFMFSLIIILSLLPALTATALSKVNCHTFFKCTKRVKEDESEEFDLIPTTSPSLS